MYGTTGNTIFAVARGVNTRSGAHAVARRSARGGEADGREAERPSGRVAGDFRRGAWPRGCVVDRVRHRGGAQRIQVEKC